MENTEQLTRAVAKKVFGWTICYHKHLARTTAMKDGKVIGDGLQLTGNDALHVIEHMRKMGFSCAVNADRGVLVGAKIYWCGFYSGIGFTEGDKSAEANTFPEAVFRAALKTMKKVRK